MAKFSGSPTIADVATEAGVSPATVSRVMNGTSTVDFDLAARVRAAARSLNYSASPLARSLVLGKTHTLGFVVPDLGNPTFHGALRGLTRAAAQHGYHVLVAETAETASEEPLLAIETRRRCDGIVLVAPRMPERKLRALLRKLAPVVLINRDLRGVTAPIVAADYRAGICELIRHVFSLGHRQVLYLAGVAASASNAQRLEGLDEFASEHHSVAIATLACGVTFADGHRSIRPVLDSGATAVLAFNDLVAMGLLSALLEAGVRVPDDISITGFDDIPFARYTTPPLTTTSVPVAELGEHAWRRMWSLLNGENPEQNYFVRPTVEIRGSTGPVPIDASYGRPSAVPALIRGAAKVPTDGRV